MPLVCGMVVCFAAAGLWDLLAGRIPNRWLAFWYTAGFVYFACSSWLAAAGYLVRSAATVGLFFLLFLPGKRNILADDVAAVLLFV